MHRIVSVIVIVIVIVSLILQYTASYFSEYNIVQLPYTIIINIVTVRVYSRDQYLYAVDGGESVRGLG